MYYTVENISFIARDSARERERFSARNKVKVVAENGRCFSGYTYCPPLVEYHQRGKKVVSIEGWKTLIHMRPLYGHVT